MQDWDVYLRRVGEALDMPPSRPPGIGIAVVNADAASHHDCH
jgi:hydrogenase-1 operon protein HyaE